MKYLKETATLKYFPEKCTGCGRCGEVCPHNVFSMSRGKAVVAHRDRCMECGACAKNCDFGAISVDAGVGCAAAVINGILRGTEPSCDCGGSSGSACCC
ncbi:MAG TPA: mercury methylation ferredoxin HgcB [Spirochaetota bacterium]|nr:mercury methylation ferredoxin HgcB [Spirochaetota bacterium]HQP49403.1 mercury methylation ferredoxin HgcB [Spirochaetota bacterium]HQP50105.1 mercury methylation ferredoxin HgcB [Spirochaetota bacterium]